MAPVLRYLGDSSSMNHWLMMVYSVGVWAEIGTESSICWASSMTSWMSEYSVFTRSTVVGVTEVAR